MDGLIFKAMRHVESPNVIMKENSDKDSLAQSHFTAHFKNDEVFRVMQTSIGGENESARYRLLSNERQRITSGEDYQ